MIQTGAREPSLSRAILLSRARLTRFLAERLVRRLAKHTWKKQATILHYLIRGRKQRQIFLAEHFLQKIFDILTNWLMPKQANWLTAKTGDNFTLSNSRKKARTNFFLAVHFLQKIFDILTNWLMFPAKDKRICT